MRHTTRARRPLRWLACLTAGWLTALAASAQPLPTAPAAGAPEEKYWVFFTDKPSPEAVPPVSARALARRARRGTAPAPGMDAPVSPAYLARLGREGVTPLVESRWLNAVSARLTPAQAERVRALPFVRGLRPVARAVEQAHEAFETAAPVSPVFTPAALQLEYGFSRTQLAMINAIAPLERGVNGTGVLFGILDTYYEDFQHVAFAKMLAEGRLLADSNFVGLPQTNTHGRNVASIAFGFAEGNLVGPGYGATVVAATTEYAPTETNKEEDDFVRALEWMEGLGVDVVNVSLGYTDFNPGQRDYTHADLDGDTGVTTIAADRAASLGVVMVVSAGNDGGCGSPQNCWYYVGTPADGDSVIAVGAVNPDSTRAGFSSFGPTADGRIKPDVSAPGGVVLHASGTSNFSFGGGTSYAAPLVSGVVAQILQVNPNLNPIEVRDLLRSTASQAERPDNALGWGIIDADAAIRRAEAIALGREVPAAYRFVQPYPNPATGPITFEVHAPEPLGEVRLAVYDLLGRQVAAPAPHDLGPGVHRLRFDGNDLAPGVYLYVLDGPAVHETGRVVVVR